MSEIQPHAPQNLFREFQRDALRRNGSETPIVLRVTSLADLQKGRIACTLLYGGESLPGGLQEAVCHNPKEGYVLASYSLDLGENLPSFVTQEFRMTLSGIAEGFAKARLVLAQIGISELPERISGFATISVAPKLEQADAPQPEVSSSHSHEQAAAA